MKFFENIFNYDYDFSTVTLAFFLRYPNPYSRHVLTADVIDRYVDPATQRLHTTRLLLKKSKIPSAMLKFLPKGIGGAENSGQSFILETSVVDVNEGWMQTESRNMEWTGILSVVEKQQYWPLEGEKDDRTTVKTTVTFRSRLGQGMLARAKKSDHSSSGESGDEDAHSKRGLLASWSTAGIQRTIELVGLKRTRDAIVSSKQGMNVVLERLRNGGIVGVLEAMRQEREALGPEGPWKRVWRQGTHGHGHGHDHSHAHSHVNADDDR
ncbi:hypothetical protein FQN52_002508 [Onygenales sp. PD_12]|nr:hypothetical protein FQN52_002508 [Onygenales sp. PD_12]